MQDSDDFLFDDDDHCSCLNLKASSLRLFTVFNMLFSFRLCPGQWAWQCPFY